MKKQFTSQRTTLRASRLCGKDSLSKYPTRPTRPRLIACSPFRLGVKSNAEEPIASIAEPGQYIASFVKLLIYCGGKNREVGIVQADPADALGGRDQID